MKKINRLTRSLLATVFAVCAVLGAPGGAVFAHGGEDHGEEKAPAVSSSANMLTRTARAGDLEITIKHPPVEPDKGTAARVFVTRFDSNEPVEKAVITLLFAGNGARTETTAKAGGTAGMYEAELPPLPQGEYKLTARVESDGATQTVEYGGVSVASAPVSAAESGSTWARTGLIALGVLVGLGLAGFALYRVAQPLRRDRTARETATA